MRKEIPEETIKQATDLFYSCEPVVDNQDGTLYLPISDIAKMQTSRSSVLANLNLRELETTFRLLDVNGDGKLTLEEFVDGFSQFLLAAQSTETARIIQKRRAEEEIIKNQELKGEVTRARENSVASLAIIQQLFSSTLYNTIKTTMPKLVTEFESMIQQASKEIDDMQKSMHQLECKLESNTTAYHQSLDQAYSELESKIRQAEEMSKARLEQRTRQINTEWDQILAEKVEQVNELKQRISEANRKTEQLRQTQAQETEQIEILRKENDKLTEALEEVESSVEESKHTIEDLQTTARVEQAKREKADAFTCKRIQIECEELMRKLDQLRELNRRLRDERDEALNDDRARKLISTNSLMDEVNEVFERQNVCAEEGTEMTAQVLQSGEITSPQDAVVTATEVFSDEDYEFEDSWSQSVDSFKLNKSIYEAERPEGTDQLQKPQQAAVREEVFGDRNKGAQISNAMNGTISGQPTELGRGLRMFKVVVVGQSGSGRTALVSRICGDKEIDKAEEVREEIELRVCSLEVDGERVVIQFWDIQGDDKYFPVNQYICEKADGVIFVYAGCSMSDFNQLDHRIMKMLKGLKTTKKLWEDTVNVLWANKWDLVNSSPALLPVPRSSAEGLAKTLEADYFEVSAKTGYNVDSAVETFVRKLCQAQDSKLQMAQENLFPSTEKKPTCLSCCSM
ncbi:Ras- protein Rab-33B [Clonorchis sinensis]|uniref:Ras- protein Rab-33B n=1 Tax=Clonorchis sinensis TaxID=79923 RepID=A0A8T1MLT5_CLOSI|nr:Ras- protein Rab-33B [Clonorchis sinensis]